MRHRIAIIAALTFLAVGCSDKAQEQFNDAPRGKTNDAPADVISFPDGFSNVATKCDHGNRVYSAFKGDANRSAIAVVPNDPTCVAQPS